MKDARLLKAAEKYVRELDARHSTNTQPKKLPYSIDQTTHGAAFLAGARWQRRRDLAAVRRVFEYPYTHVFVKADVLKAIRGGG